MRIVLVSWRDLANRQAGGSEVVVDRLLRELRVRGHEVALVCGGPVGARPYPVVAAGGTYSQYLLAPLEVLRRFSGWDLLVDVENGVPYFSPLWWRGARICLVHHVHTEQWSTRFGPLVASLGRFAESVVMPRVYRHDLFVAISPSTARSLVAIGVDEERIRTVESGVDVSCVDAAVERSKEPLFLTAGRLVPHKRTELVLEAWERVRPLTGGRLVVIGDGPEQGRLEAIAGPGVEFLGRVGQEERDRLMAEAWLLVHAAHHEGWGLVIAEAGAVGTPAVAMDAPGVHDVILDGETGFLAASVEELVERWLQLASDAELRRRLGEGAKRRMEGLTWSRTVEGFLQAADEAMSARQSRRRRRER